MITNVRVIIGSAAGLGMAIGAATGYFVAVHVLEKRYDERLDAEVLRTEEQFRMLTKTGKYSDPENLTTEYEDVEELTDLQSAVKELGYVSYNKVRPKEEDNYADLDEQVEGRAEVYDAGDDEFDFKREEYSRSSGKPYVITFEEFHNEGITNSKASLTYFDGDDTLVDDQNIPVDNIEYTVGPEGLERFGQGSKDKNVVYIRNESTSTDFEITKDDGSFADFIYGGEVEHTDKVRKFRGGYE